eukprot:TRINITY_DN4528_c0_g1_i2.p1 TRINITY_DN4528_c0_g1~~TRINITY_DN4528_c0_g1_i2.p1  ORF type:complete len:466 (+),score=110.78 TRINITY_DN4528_c0_g1_i2:58-1398(+)
MDQDQTLTETPLNSDQMEVTNGNTKQDNDVVMKDTPVNEKIQVDVIPSERFDLQSYIGDYFGHTRVSRLLFIASRCSVYKEDALRMAVDEIKQGVNTSVYRKLFDKEREFLGEIGIVFDSSWVDSTDRKAQITLEGLEIDLQTNRQNLDKPKIRVSHLNIGKFHYDRGEFGNALRSFIRTQDYCSSPDNILEMCTHVIDASIEMENFAHVMNYLPKGESAASEEDKVTAANLNAISGLANLRVQKYKTAARKFVNTEFDINLAQILTPRDIAVYGGICALAEFDRGELLRNVIDNVSFKNFLELEPQMNSIIHDFYNSNYASCLENLNLLKNDLQLDIHIHSCLDNLYKKVRNKALVQYFSPYISIDMVKMADAFQTDIKSLEEELSQLIIDGSISARIDSYNTVLIFFSLLNYSVFMQNKLMKEFRPLKRLCKWEKNFKETQEAS